MAEYEKVTVEALPDTPNPTRHKKEVDEAVGATEFGFNLYVADPGEQLPWGYHRHPDHEELFYVLAGTLAVETKDDTFEVGPGEALFIPRDAPNKAVAIGEEPARVIAVGAPKTDDGAVISEECPSCGTVSDRSFEVVDGDYILSCTACGEEVDQLTA
ncbi:MAG: cupin domain-containing protein [Halobacteriales archaeon]